MKTEIISLITDTIGGNTVQGVLGRTLHASLQIRTRFNDWIVRRIEEYGFEEDKDFREFFTESTEEGVYSNLSKSQVGRPAKEYILTLDMAKELAMLEKNEIGREVRRYFIACERKWQAAQRDQLVIDTNPLLITTERLPTLPQKALLSLETRQSLESICQALNIISKEAYATTSVEEILAKPGRIDTLDVVPLLAAVLDDIWNWRYPYPYAYGCFGHVGRGMIYLNLDHVLDHLCSALHFNDFFIHMKSGAKWRIEQALMRGALPKIKKGPVVNDVRLNYRVDMQELLDAIQRIRERPTWA